MQTKFNITWEIGTAYDFIVSLIILHDPKNYGLRPKWASAIRQRLPQQSRDTLELLMEGMAISPNLYWIYDNVAQPRDAAAFIAALHKMPPLECLSALLGIFEEEGDYTEFVREVLQQKSWQSTDIERAKRIYQERGKPKSEHFITRQLNIWAKLLDMHADVLAALQAYYDVFFSEEEYRILAAIQQGLNQAKQLANEHSFTEFFEKISSGVVYTEEQFADEDEMIFAPSFWATPFVFISLSKTPFFLFGARPDDASLMPGEVIPDILVNSLNALSDPTRLRILRYLSIESLTPTQISKRLHLRTATVAHHMKILRSAGLVIVKYAEGNKKQVYYSTRIDHLQTVCSALYGFVNQEDEKAD